MLAVTTAWPAAGLLLVAALAPLGDMLAPLLGARVYAHAEAIVLAFLTIWLAATSVDSDRGVSIGSRAATAAFVFAAIVVASVASNAYQLYRGSPTDFHLAVSEIARGLLFSSNTIGARTAANLLEGLGVTIATAQLVRSRRWLRVGVPIVLILGGTAGAIGSALLAKGIAPAATIARQTAFGWPRYAATIGDLNAAGSWYVLLFGIVLGVIVLGRGTARALCVAIAGLLAWGIWLAGSRSAIAALGLILCVAAVIVWRHNRSRTVKVAAAVLSMLTILAAVRLAATSTGVASLEIRKGFTATSLSMIEDRPAFGVGIGRYYPLSQLFLPPDLAWLYGRENAHDYYLQLAAEVGITGLGAFAWMLAALFASAARRAMTSTTALAATGCVLGAIGYLATCASGHPLLPPETAMPFWMVAGMAASCAAVERRDRLVSRAVAVPVVALLAITVPLRANVPRVHVTSGQDAAGSDGIFLRTTFNTIYVNRRATGVELDLRAPGASVPLPVSIAVPGWTQTTILVGPGLQRTSLSLPGTNSLVPAQAINFKVHAPPVEIVRLRILSFRTQD